MGEMSLAPAKLEPQCVGIIFRCAYTLKPIDLEACYESITLNDCV